MASAFLLTPFSAETAGGEDEERFTRVQKSIVEAADRAGVDLQTAADIFASGVVIDQIRGEIQRADLIVAVCTGRNPNVFYELGYAHAHGHEPVLIAATSNDLPFDMSHQRAHLYDGDAIDTLTNRIENAIRETLEQARSTTITVPDAGETTQEGMLPGALELVQDDDWIRFNEGFKALVARLGNEFASVVDENWDAKPSDDALDQLKQMRFDLAQSLVVWLAPAIEYKPDWLSEALRLLVPWYQKRARPGGGYDFWIHANETWVLLTLRAVLTLALLQQKEGAVRAVFLTTLSTDQETAPLLIHYDATFSNGYFGNAEIAFQDFIAFAEHSPTIGEVTGRLGLEVVQAACGEDLVNGLARSILEDERSAGSPPSPRSPLVFAAFASYYCSRIQWAARLVSDNDDIAKAIGASSSADLNEKVTMWYPRLVGQRKGRLGTCQSWEQATA